MSLAIPDGRMGMTINIPTELAFAVTANVSQTSFHKLPREIHCDAVIGCTYEHITDRGTCTAQR